MVGWFRAWRVWDWHYLSQPLGKTSWRSSLPASCLCSNWREGCKDGRVCTGLVAVPVSLGHGHEYDLQQTGRKHGEMDGAAQRYQVRKMSCQNLHLTPKL